MSNTELLFIRACKSKHPHQRVRSVYRRFYLNCEYDHATEYIANLLVNICDKYNLMSTGDMVIAVHPANRWKYGNEDDSYWTAIFNITLSRIRLTEVKKFPGFIPPRSFR